MPDEFVAIDLETTGLSLEDDRITEVGATRFDRSGRVETFHALVNPGRPIPREIQELTAITDADVADAPPFSAVASQLADFIGDRPLVGQNLQFDLAFLQAEGLHPPGRSYDTWQLASVLLPTAERLNLASLAALVGVDTPSAHRALADAEVARDVFLALLARLEALPRSLLLELRTFAERAGWALVDLVDDALERTAVEPGTEGAGVAGEEAAAIVARLRAPARPAPAPPLEPAEERRPVTASDIEALLAGAGSRPDLFPGFEARWGQEQMAQAVRRTIADGGHLLAEAATGTGKSLAYLLPGLLNALRNGERLVVSTHTLNLQDQLAAHDIPSAAALVEAHEGAEAGSLRSALLKGRGNYLCLDRWAATRADARPVSEAEARLYGRIAAWLPGTETGDVSELYMTSQEQPAWAKLSARDADCLSRRCAYVRDGSCFLLRARQRAAAAHVVVVNHALLLANASRDDQVLPAFRHLVIDEAHRLEDVATQHYGASLSVRELREVLEATGAAERHGNPGVAYRLRGAPLAAGTALSAAAGLRPAAEALAAAVSGARERLPALAEAVRRFTREYGEEEGVRSELSLTAGRRAQPGWEDVEDAALQLDMALQNVADRLNGARDALTALPEDAFPGEEPLRSAVTEAAGDVYRARVTLHRVVLRPDREEITWLSTAEGDVRLSLAPLEVGGRLSADLYESRDSVVATSATLKAAGSFAYSIDRLGLWEPETLEIPSPFDYRRSVLTLLVEDMPEPGMPGYDVAVQEVLEETARGAGGRTLALFTAHGSLRDAAEALRERLREADVLVLAQGVDGSPARLLRLLMARPRSLVLGTAAFWEGIDVPGEALSQIVVARLPFPVPTDPIYAGRAEAYEDPFGEFAIPQAVLRFRQGFGRLIRSSTDRGVFVVADSRIHRRAYGQAFLDALPDCEVRTVRSDRLGEIAAEWLGRASP